MKCIVRIGPTDSSNNIFNQFYRYCTNKFILSARVRRALVTKQEHNNHSDIRHGHVLNWDGLEAGSSKIVVP